MRLNVIAFMHGRKIDHVHSITNKELTMWTKPEVTEMRFGFEVTMYVCNR
jgi:pyrroloquinoline quinone biosynthesis protein A